MKRNIVGFLLTLLLVGFTATAVGGGYNPHPRPFMGSMSGEAIGDYDSGACLDVTGAPWQTFTNVAGNITHLGLAEFHMSHCSTLDGTQLVNGAGTLVAANGDEIWVTYTANLISPFTPPPVVLVYLQHTVVVGGTGRFEGASGTFLGLVSVTVESLTAPILPIDANFAGSITY
jgi:hypothetical protein